MQLYKKSFPELSLNELYSILKLRNAVFIVEQNCPYQDIDGKDQSSSHVLGVLGEELVAYIRIVHDEIPAIGRVIVAENHRNKGYARKIMEIGIEEVIKEYGPIDIKLQAQTYLQPFYESMGFAPISEEYLEDDIPHRDMILKMK